MKFQGPNRRQFVAVIAGGVLALMLAVGGIVYVRQFTPLAGLPREAYRGLTFPVYFPKHPPSGFVFDPKSVSSRSKVLAYNFTYQGQKPVNVSIQPLDPSLDVTSFNPTRIINPPIGTGYLAVYDTRTTVAIVAGKSLVLVNSPDGVPDAMVEQFANSLQVAN